MMKKLLLAALLLPACAGAQVNWNQVFGKQRFQQGLGLPSSDTTNFKTLVDTSAFVLQRSDSSLYFRYKGWWRKLAIGSSSTSNLQQVLNAGSVAYNRNIVLYDTTGSSTPFYNYINIQAQQSGGPLAISMRQGGGFTHADYTSQNVYMYSNATYGGTNRAMFMGSNGSTYYLGFSPATGGSGNEVRLTAPYGSISGISTLTLPQTTATLATAVSLNGTTFSAGSNGLVTIPTNAVFFPKLTDTQIGLLTPVEGMIVYSLTQHVLAFYDGTNWRKISHSLL